MKFDSRSFRGNSYSLPTPEIFFDPEDKLLIIATGWGKSNGAKKVVQTLSEYFLSTHNDREATTPFRRFEYLSTNANNLRIAALLANELLFREENKNEYRAGVELFACSLQDRELSWVHVGHPHVIFARKGRPLLPLSMQLSLSAEVTGHTDPLPPLPNKLLGLSLEPYITHQSICLQPGDSLILLSQAWVNDELYSLSENDRNISGISQALAGKGDDPFWLGLLEI